MIVAWRGLRHSGGVPAFATTRWNPLSGGAGLTIVLTGVVSAEAIGSPSVILVQRVLPTAIASQEAIGSPILSPGSVTISPNGVTSAEAIGSPIITLRLILAGLASAGAIGTPTIAPGSVVIVLTGVASADAIGSPIIIPGQVTIVLTGIASAEALGSPTLDLKIFPAGVASADAIGIIALTGGISTIALTGAASAQALGVPTLVPSPVSIVLDGIPAPQFIPATGRVLDESLFTGTETPLSEGGRWVAIVSLSPNGGRLQKDGGVAFPTMLSPDHAGARTTTQMPADQYSEVVVGAVDATQGNVGPIVRVQASGVDLDSHYLWWVGAANKALYRIDADGASYNAVGLTVAVTAAVAGDTCRLSARGAALYGTINGRRVIFGWDTTYASGQAGLLIFQTSPPTTIDSWAAGEQPPLASGSGINVWDASGFTGADEVEQSGIDENDRWYPPDVTSAIGPVWRAGGVAAGSQSGRHSFAANWRIAPPDTQYAEVTLGAVVAGGGGPMVRMSRGAHTGYLLFIFKDSPGASGIYKWTGSDNFAQLQAFTPSRIQTGDTWGLYANGTSLDVKLNGVSIGGAFPVTDSSYASGDVGVNIFSDSMTFTAWEGGDVNGPKQLDAIGAPQLNLVVTPTGVGSGQAFGIPTLHLAIVPNGVASAGAFGIPTITLTLLLDAIASAEAIGTPSIHSGVTVHPDGLPSGEAVGAPQINLTVLLAGVASSFAAGLPIIQGAATIVFPDGLASALALGTPTIAPGVVIVTLAGVASGVALGTPIVINPSRIYPPGLDSGEAIGVVSVAALIGLAGVPSEEALGAPLLSQVVFPGGLTSEEAIGVLRILGGIGFLPGWDAPGVLAPIRPILSTGRWAVIISRRTERQ